MKPTTLRPGCGRSGRNDTMTRCCFRRSAAHPPPALHRPIRSRLWLTTGLPVLLTVFSCGDGDGNYDASGTFEADEVIVGAHATGMILQFDAEEGQDLEAGQVLGTIDSVQLVLKKQQLQAQVTATLSQLPDIRRQVSSLDARLRAARVEQGRVTRLERADAATKKQLDDVNAEVEVLEGQLAALRSTLEVTSSSLHAQVGPLEAQIAQVEDQIEKCRIVNPVKGTVLTKYAEAKEMATTGRPLYKVADLRTLVLRAYITGDQLASVTLGQAVRLWIDEAHNGRKEYEGTVEWVSDKAEFTPKTIQTRKERADLVYAIKIRVRNDGILKVGMYADIAF